MPERYMRRLLALILIFSIIVHPLQAIAIEPRGAEEGVIRETETPHEEESSGGEAPGVTLDPGEPEDQHSQNTPEEETEPGILPDEDSGEENQSEAEAPHEIPPAEEPDASEAPEGGEENLDGGTALPNQAKITINWFLLEVTGQGEEQTTLFATKNLYGEDGEKQTLEPYDCEGYDLMEAGFVLNRERSGLDGQVLVFTYGGDREINLFFRRNTANISVSVRVNWYQVQDTDDDETGAPVEPLETLLASEEYVGDSGQRELLDPYLVVLDGEEVNLRGLSWVLREEALPMEDGLVSFIYGQDQEVNLYFEQAPIPAAFLLDDGFHPVGDSASLKAALEDAGISQIRLTEDIQVEAQTININPRKPELVIDGSRPGGGRYTLSEFVVSTGDSSKGIRLVATGQLKDITVQNLDIVGGNSYGTIYSNQTNVKISYINVGYKGPQLVHNTGSRSIVYLENCDILIAGGGVTGTKNTYTGAVAETNGVTLAGKIKIEKRETDGFYDEVFRINGIGVTDGIVIAEGADVDVVYRDAGPGNGGDGGRGGFVYFSGNQQFTVEDNAKFVYSGHLIFLDYGNIDRFSIGEGCQVNIAIQGKLTERHILQCGSIYVGKGSVFHITAPDGKPSNISDRSLIRTNSLHLDSPLHFVAYIGGGTAIYIDAAPRSYDLTGVNRIRYWNSASGSGVEYDKSLGILLADEADRVFRREDMPDTFSLAAKTGSNNKLSSVSATPAGEVFAYAKGGGRDAVTAANFDFSGVEVVEIIGNTALLTLRYDSNGFDPANGRDTGLPPENREDIVPLEMVEISGQNTMERYDYDFLGWNTSKSGADDGTVEYTQGQRYTAKSDMVLYAVWKAWDAKTTNVYWVQVLADGSERTVHTEPVSGPTGEETSIGENLFSMGNSWLFDSSRTSSPVVFAYGDDDLFFYYNIDENENGIPDKDEGTVIAEWIKVYATQEEEIVYSEQLTGLAGEGGAFSPDYHDMGPGWILNADRSGDGAFLYKKANPDTVRFYYNEEIPAVEKGQITVNSYKVFADSTVDEPVTILLSDQHGKAVVLHPDDYGFGAGWLFDPGASGNLILAFDKDRPQTVNLYFDEDADNSGYPDKKEGKVTADWIMMQGDRAGITHQRETITALDGTSGTINPLKHAPSGSWFLDTEISDDGSYTIVKGQTQTLRFYFELDENGNGIPDRKEGAIVAQWHTVDADGSTDVYATMSFIEEDGKTGRIDHLEHAPAPSGWIFDQARSSDGNYRVVKGESQYVDFYYDIDANGNNIPDKDEGSVTARWIKVYATQEETIAYSKQFTGLAGEGGTISPDYHDMGPGWMLDTGRSDDGSFLYKKENPDVVQFFFNEESPTIEEGQITVNSYKVFADGSAGEPVVIHLSGEHGTTVVVSPDEYGFGEGWLFDAASSGALIVTFDKDRAQIIHFYFDEDADHSGYPDKNEGSVTTNWIMIQPEGNGITFQTETITALDGVSGSIDPRKYVPSGTWILDPETSDDGSYTVVKGRTQILSFYFELDKNGNGIPDRKEGSVSARWIMVRENGTGTVFHTETITALDGATGTVDPLKHAPPGNWLLDTEASDDGSYTIVQGQTQTINFYFELDANGNEIPDRKEGAVSARWIMVQENGTGAVFQTETVTTLDGATGSIDPFKHVPSGNWFLDADASDDGSYTIIQGRTKTISFYFELDENGNGIADRKEGTVTVQWIQVYSDADERVSHTETFVGRAGERGSVSPDRHDMGSSWVLDAGRSGDGSFSYKKANPDTVSFFYNQLPEQNEGQVVVNSYKIFADGSVSEAVSRLLAREHGKTMVLDSVAYGFGEGWLFDEASSDSLTVTFDKNHAKTVNLYYSEDANGSGGSDGEYLVDVKWVAVDANGVETVLFTQSIAGPGGDIGTASREEHHEEMVDQGYQYSHCEPANAVYVFGDTEEVLFYYSKATDGSHGGTISRSSGQSGTDLPDKDRRGGTAPDPATSGATIILEDQVPSVPLPATGGVTSTGCASLLLLFAHAYDLSHKKQ